MPKVGAVSVFIDSGDQQVRDFDAVVSGLHVTGMRYCGRQTNLGPIPFPSNSQLTADLSCNKMPTLSAVSRRNWFKL